MKIINKDFKIDFGQDITKKPFSNGKAFQITNVQLKLKNFFKYELDVTKKRFELSQAFAHYHLKVACLPVSPPRH